MINGKTMEEVGLDPWRSSPMLRLEIPNRKHSALFAFHEKSFNKYFHKKYYTFSPLAIT